MIELQPSGSDDSARWLEVLGNLPSGGDEVVATRGDYSLNGTFPIPDKSRLRLACGARLKIGTTNGGDVFQIGNGASFDGDDPPRSEILLLGTAKINRLITNSKQDGSQEYAYLRGLGLTIGTGAQVTGSVFYFVSVFVDSGISRVLVNCNRAGGPGISVRGGSVTGFGPVYIEKTWVTHSSADSYVLTEANPYKGACTAWLRDVTAENQASGFHGLRLTGYGGMGSIDVLGYHYENGFPVDQPTAAVYIDGVPHVEIRSSQLLSLPIANKLGFWITKHYRNRHIQIEGVANPNLINPVLRNDLTGEILATMPDRYLAA